MLKGIPPIMSPDLVKTLMEMGHGDELVLGDGNFPASYLPKHVVSCQGLGIPQLLDAILPFFPLDYRFEKPVFLMSVPADINTPEIWQQYYDIISKNYPNVKEFEHFERYAFYERVKNAYALVTTSETARFSTIILRKGVVTF